MSVKNLALVGVIAVLVIAYVAWNRNTQKPATPQMQSETPAAGGSQGMPPQAMPPHGNESQAPMVESGTDPGLAWSAPSGWTDRGPSSMRLATYVIRGPKDTEAQCAVYYFGPGQGGSPEANLDRWKGEFSKTKSENHGKLTAHGVTVDKISLSGTYMAHVGMMGSGSSTETADWALLGAIAQGPNGSVFFKLTGPEVAVQGAAGEFGKMLESLHRR